MAEFYLTHAVKADFSTIKALVYQTKINPMSLDWHRFYVAKSVAGDQLIGCGQLKPHGGGLTELASIATHPAWRSKGIASAIMQKLMDEGPRPLYLTCRATMGPFYEKFGFHPISGNALPKYYRRLSTLAGAFNILHLMNDKLLVMQLD